MKIIGVVNLFLHIGGNSPGCLWMALMKDWDSIFPDLLCSDFLGWFRADHYGGKTGAVCT